MKIIRRSIYLLLFCLLAAVSAFAEDSSALKAAEEAYQNGNFAKAIKEYEQLLADGYKSSDLHYNLGNAYYRARDLGRAVLHLEKAALLNPRDKDIRHNLKVVKKNIPDQIETIPPFFIQRWWDTLQALFNPALWGIIGLLILWAGIGGLIVWLRADSRQKRKQGFTLGVAALLLCILPVSIAFSTIKEMQNSQRAVILVSETSLKSAPDEVSEEILRLHAGISLRVLDEIGEWKKIRLSNGEEGWLETKVLGFI